MTIKLLLIACAICVLVSAEIQDGARAKPRRTTTTARTTTTTTAKPPSCQNTKTQQCPADYHAYVDSNNSTACLPDVPAPANQTIYYMYPGWCSDDCPDSCNSNPIQCFMPPCPPRCTQCSAPPAGPTPTPHCTNNAYECPSTHRCDVSGSGTWCLVYSGDQTQNVSAPVHCSDNCPSTCSAGSCTPCKNHPGFNWCFSEYKA